ncbi:HNH endonuclease family protein [hydrothermal vent metagenome]|uniref:HNH endonuclease family protein n=1 Tax=hydrothermal vent metagenome TaxID=652676 RepID=A0A3B0RYM5_9ZZZZ
MGVITPAARGWPCLVLNADFAPLSYQPLSLVPWQEAVKDVFLDRVTPVAHYDHAVHSPSAQMLLPSVVALKSYVQNNRQVAFTRFNVFLRDGFSCVYCGSGNELTFDHLIPRSKGGTTHWGNIVTACSPCNLRKGGRLPKVCGMSPKRPPRRPSPYELQAMGRKFPPNFLHESWLDYLYWDVELEG